MKQKLKNSIINKKVITATLVTAIITVILLLKIANRPLFSDPYATVILDRNSHLLSARIATDEQWRFPELSKVSDRYITALTTFEDKRYFSHFGVDPVSLVRALYSNISNGKVVSGASTISMQVIRLSRKENRTYTEKLTEMLLAVLLEAKYSKNEILNLYASHAPFGGNIVGISAASRFYFNRDISELTWAESALLAVLPNNPSMIHPGRNRVALKAKRDTLLQELFENSEMDSLAFQLAISEPLPTKRASLPKLTPQLLNTVEKEEGNLYKLTIDRDFQQNVSAICERYSTKQIEKNIRNLAAIVVDNETGDVISYVPNTHEERTGEFGQYIDLIQCRRSSGSILKPILFFHMIKNGDIAPKTLIHDIPTQYGGFMPSNYDKQYRGAVTASYALIRSLNIPAVRMLNYYGTNVFYNNLKNMGITTIDRPVDDYGLTLILGGCEVNLFDVVNVYSSFAQMAYKDSITNIHLYDTKPVERGVSDKDKASAFITLETLLNVNRPGVDGFWKNFNSSRKIAWKTGTSFGLRDAWSVGVTPKYTVGVWVGNADGEGVTGISGIEAAAPLMFDIFNFLGDDRWFVPPEGVFENVATCTESGMLASPHCPIETIQLPKNAGYQNVCTYHKLVHLDSTGTYQVDSRVLSPSKMKHKIYFQLPPLMEYYYIKNHADYEVIPSFSHMVGNAEQSKNLISIVYPQKETEVYVPLDLDGKPSAVVLQAVHKHENRELFWHIDDEFIATTTLSHSISVNPCAGEHTLTIVDGEGNYVTRTFTVIDVKKDL